MAGLTFEIGGLKYLKVYVFEPQALFLLVLVAAAAVLAAAGVVCGAAGTFFAAAGAFFSRALKQKGARIHVLMVPCGRAALQDQSSLFIMQFRCLWRE